MKSCHIYKSHWAIVVALFAFFRQMLAQGDFSGSETCEEGDTNCESSLIDDYKRQADQLNDLLANLNNVENNLRYRYRNRIHRGYPSVEPLREGPRISMDHPRKNFDGTAYFENKRDSNPFSSWGGKRDTEDKDKSPKRESGFSSWGGKRTQKFFNWGGKRSSDQDATSSEGHNVMKRSIENQQTRGKRLCITDEINLQELFKEFIDWSRKQPEQKKGSVYRKMFGLNALHGPDNVSRRAGSFFQWGGKRNIQRSNHK